MIEQSVDSVEYGVDVKWGNDPEWRARYGWFREHPKNPGDETGLKRAERNAKFAREDPHNIDVRIVKRTIKIEVVQ